MADRDSETRPIQVFLDTRQFITVQKSRPWGGVKDFFKGNDEGFMRHKAHMRRKIQTAAESLRIEGHPAGFLMVRMREVALGKSYRPLNALFSRKNGFALVGGGDIGEMFFQCAPETLDHLDRVIEEHAEPRPKAAPGRETGESKERVSPFRSELGGIEDILLPGPADRVRFSAREAVQRLVQPGAFGGYVVELFRPDWRIEPEIARETVGRFRERLVGVGGVLATPAMRPRSTSGGLGLLAISVHLIPEAEESIILLPLSEEVSEFAGPDRVQFRTVPELPAMRDLSLERHQGLLEMLSAEPMVRRVGLPPIMEVVPLSESRTQSSVQLPEPAEDGDYPVIGIVDGGVASIPALEPWRAGGVNPITPDDRDEDHGTFIAGLVAGGRRLNPHIETTLERDGCRFYDIALVPQRGKVNDYYNPHNEFFDQLEVEVMRAKAEAGVRVFNFSLGIPPAQRSFDYSIYAEALDKIAMEQDVIFVVSAGNLRYPETRPPWPVDGQRAVEMLAVTAVDQRITAPAEHLLGLSVGAVNPPGVAGHEADVPTIYTRRGPGAGRARKPDLCHYGGVSRSGGNQTGLFSFDGDGCVVDNSGTSFAAPLVGATVAAIDFRLKGMVPRETLMALPIHRAERCAAMQHRALRHVAREFVGFGMAPLSDVCLTDSPHSVTLVFAETLEKKRELDFVFSWPRSLVLSNGKCRGQVDLTLVFTPPIDADFGAECLRAQLEASLYQIEIDPSTGEDNPQSRLKGYDAEFSQGLERTERYLLQTGLKWAPVKRYRLSMPKGRGNSSNWRLTVRSFTRAGASYPEKGVPFTLIMTIADPQNTAQVYDEVRAEIFQRGLGLADITAAYRLRAHQ